MGNILDPAEVLLELGLSSSVTDEERAIVGQKIVQAEGAVIAFLRYNPALLRLTEYYPEADLSVGDANYLWEVNDTTAYARSESTGQTTQLQLKRLPVRASPAMDLRIDHDGRFGTASGSFAAATAQTEGTDFWAKYTLIDFSGNGVCFDGILRSNGLWPLESGTVRVTYTAGYTEEELHGKDAVIDASPIWTAAMEEAKRRVEQVMVRKKSTLGWAAGPKSSESLGDYSYSIDSSLAKSLYGNAKSLTDESQQLLEPFVNKAFVL